MNGKTVLYIPEEKRVPEKVSEAIQDKELVSRLETTMIHWTRQIKEVLSAQEAVETNENDGPLEEIQFWRNRCADLSGLSKQLDLPSVKKVEQILAAAKSSYLQSFRKLSRLIQDGSNQAQENLKYLNLLKEPCEKLTKSHPKDTASQLTYIIRVIRFIWTQSTYYNTRERLTGLFRKLSNEIIRICSKSISLKDIFAGKAKSSMATLHQCIDACVKWKTIYRRTAQSQHRFSEMKWVLDQSSIFAQVDAFVQRCRDLIEVCKCQMHFARWEDGDKTIVPIFFGQRGPEITRSLLEIEATFTKNLRILINVEKAILDVKNTSWHEEFSRFRTAVKELEVMVQNLISSAFETVRSVDEGVMLLDVFGHFGAREAIKRTIDKKTVEVFYIFSDQLNAVKRELSSKRDNIHEDHPRFAGQAFWARLLRRRVDRPYRVLKQTENMLNIGSGKETKAAYEQLVAALDEFVRKTFNDWAVMVDRQSFKRLECPLMVRSALQRQLLDINFDHYLLKLFVEIAYWELLMFEIPHYAADVYQRREELRNLREHVMLVVRDYNRVITELNQDEIGLFKERIKVLDKKVQPGLTRLNWSQNSFSEFYIGDCRLHASKVMAIVTEYKLANQVIASKCRTISESLLIDINSKKVYEELQFKDEQLAHKERIAQKLYDLYHGITIIMRQQFVVFQKDGSDVYRHWVKYTERIDQYVEDAFKMNVKFSLHEISKAINGDGKMGPNPLFRVNITLACQQPNQTTPKVGFSPTLESLLSVVCKIAEELPSVCVKIRRLPDVLTRSRNYGKASIMEVINRDDETRKIRQLIQDGISQNNQHLIKFIEVWDEYKEIWQINKDAFIKRYRRHNPAVSSFDADIARYSEVQNNIQKEETNLTIHFVLVDSTPIKSALIKLCQEWQEKFTQLLLEMASSKLKETLEYMAISAAEVVKPPENLEELTDRIELW